MKRSQRRYVVPKTPELEMQVDTIMRRLEVESYAEMFRVLVRDAYRHLQRDKDPHYVSLTRHDIELALDELVLDAEPPEGTAWCPVCERYVDRKMWTRDPHFCDECCRTYH